MPFSCLECQGCHLVPFFCLLYCPSPVAVTNLSFFWSPQAHLYVVRMLWFMSKDINQPSLTTPFYSVLVSISVVVALLTVFSP